jgi:hypothetical protein
MLLPLALPDQRALSSPVAHTERHASVCASGAVDDAVDIWID